MADKTLRDMWESDAPLLVPKKIRAAHEATIRAMAKELVKAEALLSATRRVLADRERELLDMKGPCSNKACRLHHAHGGPCHGGEGDHAE